MNDSFIAINVINNDSIMNSSGTPIILYLSSNDDIIKVLSENEEFKKLIQNSFTNINDYLRGKISAISIQFENENNSTYEFAIKDLFNLSIFENIKEDVVKSSFNDLYKYVYKKDYEFDKLLTTEQNLINLYTEIKNIYKDKMNSKTAYHYFLSEIKKKYDISDYDKEILSNYIINILNINDE